MNEPFLEASGQGTGTQVDYSAFCWLFSCLFHSVHYILEQSLIQNGRSLRTTEIWQETHIKRTVTNTNSLIPLQCEIQLLNLDLDEWEPLQPNQSLDIPLLVMWCHVILTLSLPQASQPSFRIRLVAPWEAKSGVKICRDILNDSCCFVGEILMMRMNLCNFVVQRKTSEWYFDTCCMFRFCVIWMN